jgi:hypothetical protein
MVDGRVVGRPRDGHRFLELNTWVYLIEPGWTGDRVGPLGGKWRPPVRKVGEWKVESQQLQGYSPCLCQLRTNGLALVRKYWMYQSHVGVYGPSKPSSRSPTRAWIMPIASLVGSGEKLGTDPQIGQPVCCGLCREPFFSGAVGSIQICRRLVKGCYMWTTSDMYGPGPYVD